MSARAAEPAPTSPKPYDNVARYYLRMQAENGAHAAMGFTLEQFEGLTEAHVDYALRAYRA